MGCAHCDNERCGIGDKGLIASESGSVGNGAAAVETGKKNVLWVKPAMAVLIALGAGAAKKYSLFESLGADADVAMYAVLTLYIAAYLIAGGDVVLRAFTNLFKGKLFDENFLMTAATVGAFFIGEYPEAVGVMVFYQIGEMVQDFAAEKSRKSISSLMDIRPLSARKLIDGKESIVLPEELAADDLIAVRPGDRIAADGIIVSGHSFIDLSALTGESVPREVCEGDTVLGGAVNTSGVLTVRVLKPYAESAAAKILELTEHASSRKASREKFITRFARWYTPAVTGAAVLLAVVPPLLLEGAEFSDWIYRALVFLVVSCPCALVLSVPLGFFAGIGAAAREGILVKGGNFLEALAHAEIAVFDKTGTLTKGVFKVSAVHPFERSSESLTALAAHAERFSAHPVSLPLREAHTETDGCCTSCASSDVQEIAGHGVSAVINGNEVLAGSARLMTANGVEGFSAGSPCSECASSQRAGTFVHVAENGQYAGHIVVSDQLKDDAASALILLKKNGIKRTVILTGDGNAAALDAAKKTGVDEVYAELLPQGKVDKVESLLSTLAGKKRGTLMFVGDGINDAPVLAMADVGIAMGGIGSDAAIEAADVVIMNDEPSKAARAVQIAKRTVRIVTENIVFVLSIKAFVLLLGAFGYAPMWAAVFADAGTAAVAALNSVRVLNTKKQQG